MGEDLVKIKTYSNETEAEMDKGRLESAGIPAMIVNDDVGGMHPQLQAGRGVKLYVGPDDVDQAREVLGLENEDA
jgi:hypothetical protein